MDSRAACRFIADAVAAGRIQFSYHVLVEEMPVERVTREDVLNVLVNPTEALAQNDEGTKWKLYGQPLGGGDLAVVVAFQRKQVVVIVTVHPLP